MNLPPTLERMIEAGLVLDREGRWIPLDEAIEREREFRLHLERGEIPVEGRWRSLDDLAVSTANPTEEKTPAAEDAEPETPPVAAVEEQAVVKSDTVLVEIGDFDDEEEEESEPPQSVPTAKSVDVVPRSDEPVPKESEPVDEPPGAWESAGRKGRAMAVAVSAAIGGAALTAFVIVKFLLK